MNNNRATFLGVKIAQIYLVKGFKAWLFWWQKTDLCISWGRFQSNWFLVKTCRLWRGGASTLRPGVMWSRTWERSSETRSSWEKTSRRGPWKSRPCQAGFSQNMRSSKRYIKSKQACLMLSVHLWWNIWPHLSFKGIYVTAFSFEKPAKWNAISADNDWTAALNTLPDKRHNTEPKIDSMTCSYLINCKFGHREGPTVQTTDLGSKWNSNH